MTSSESFNELARNGLSYETLLNWLLNCIALAKRHRLRPAPPLRANVAQAGTDRGSIVIAHTSAKIHWTIIMTKDSKWINSSAHSRLIEEFFGAHSPICVHDDIVGMRVQDSNKLILGMRAGPSRCITFLIHEMCHLVEIDDARILKPNWGLTTPQVYVPGRHSHMASVPVTIQPIKREIRVIAMAFLLQEYLGIHESKREMLSVLKWMPDWCNLPSGLPENYLDLTWQEQAKCVNTDDFRFAYMQTYMDHCLYGKYNFAFFKNEWIRKNELLRSYVRS